MAKYITAQGDTWDSIAKALYGDEVKAAELIDRNRDFLDVVVFNYGAEIFYEEDAAQQETAARTSYPEWRT